MTNLTEQWKKGELLEDFYYVKCNWSDEVEIRYVHNGVDDWQEIVEPVPSYEEWRDLEDDLATCDKDLNNVCEQKEELYEENQRLKELLKECRPYVNHRLIGTRETLTKPYTASDKVLHKKAEKLLTKIDEVLK